MSEDSFVNSIVHTSSATVIDIDAMLDTYSRAASAVDTLDQAHALCQEATVAAEIVAWHAPAHSGIGVRLMGFGDWLATSSMVLDSLCSNIASSILIYLSAEQRSADFFAVRAVADPNAETLLRRAEDIVRDMLSASTSGPWLVRRRVGAGHLGDNRFPLPVSRAVLSWLDWPTERGRWPGLYADTWRESALSIAPFALGRGGSASSLPAQALHIERHSSELLAELSVTRHQGQNARTGMGPRARFTRSEGRGSWWSAKRMPSTPQAAGVGLASARGYLRGSGKSPLGIAARGFVDGPDGHPRRIDTVLPAYREGRYVASPLASSSYAARLLARGTHIPPDTTPLWTASGAPASDALRQALEADKQRIPQRDEFSSHVHTPHHPSQLVERISRLDSSPDHGQFEILRHDTPGADGTTHRSWSVVIRGTQVWDVGGPNAQDMDTNLAGVDGDESDQTRIIREVMDQAGIGADEPVEFVGHSQGGLVAVQLASDTRITSNYQVAAVLTAGAPTGHYVPTTTAGTLNVENLRDLVPALDGSVANADQANASTVYFDGAQLLEDPTGSRPFDHDIGVYTHALERMENTNDPRTAGVHQWMEARSAALHLSEDTHTTRFVINTARVGYQP